MGPLSEFFLSIVFMIWRFSNFLLMQHLVLAVRVHVTGTEYQRNSNGPLHRTEEHDIAVKAAIDDVLAVSCWESKRPIILQTTKI